MVVKPLREEAQAQGRAVEVVAREPAAVVHTPLPRLFQPTMILYFGRGIVWPGWELFQGPYPKKIPKPYCGMFWPDSLLGPPIRMRNPS